MSYQHDFFVAKELTNLRKLGEVGFPMAFYAEHGTPLALMFCAAKGIDNVAEARRQLATLMTEATYVGFVSIPGDSKLGYLVASGNQIIDLFVEEGYRQKGIASQLLKEFMFHNELKYPQFTAVWYGSLDKVTKLFNKAGFEVTTTYDEGITSNAATPVNDAYYTRVLEDCDAYIDFRGDYVLVDGDLTIKELEALLVVARKELKDA